MHLLSEKGTVVSCGPFAVPYHARFPKLRGASILIEICFELAGGGLLRIVHFVSCHALQKFCCKAKDRPIWRT